MYRHQLYNLKEWLHRPRRKPLVLRGARQVGKSTLIELFCEAEPDHDLVTVNLERHPHLAQAFASNDPGTILNLIGAVSDTPLSDRSILFLDEIQAAPSAFASLRYFFEDMPDRPVVAAGSLIEFMLSDHTFSMPVGRIEYLNLGPMTFTEFLMTVGQDRLAREIETFEWPSSEDPTGPHPLIHRHLLEFLRLYQFVGGMPEAVRVYSESENLPAVSAVHAAIVDTWRDDFPKYAARRDLTRMLRVFHFAARHPGRKVKYSNVSPDDQSATVRRDIDLLEMARVIARVTHSQCSGLTAPGRRQREGLQADLPGRGSDERRLWARLANAGQSDTCTTGERGTRRRAVHRPAPAVSPRRAGEPGTDLLAARRADPATPRSTTWPNSAAASSRSR